MELLVSTSEIHLLPQALARLLDRLLAMMIMLWPIGGAFEARKGRACRITH
jgi:hypothetical protein